MNQPLFFPELDNSDICDAFTDLFSVLIDSSKAKGSHCLGVKSTGCIAFMLLVMLSMPVASSASTISFTGATTVEATDGSSALTIDSEQKYLASGYDDHMAIMWLENLSLIEIIDVDRPVESLEFSPDGSQLAIAISGSETKVDTIQLFDVQSMTLSAKQQAANARPVDIAWSPDGLLLAVPNANNGIDLIRISDMEIERSLTGEHNTDVTCVEFTSNGGHIISGDESGRMVMWNSDGTPTSKKWEFGNELKACSFDPTDTRIASLTTDGALNTFSFAGGALQSTQFTSGGGMSWSHEGTYIHLTENGDEPRLLTLDASTFEQVEATSMAHQVLDVATIENQFGLIQEFYAATNTLHLAGYGSHSVPEGMGVAGADLDGDGIPDTLDDDDDGDAILDQWDTYCGEIGTDCTRSPHEDHIRSLTIQMNATHMTIKDRIKLDIVLSSSIRNMSRISVIEDAQLSVSETDLFARSICANHDETRILEQWKDTLMLSEGQLEGGVVTCAVSEGMTLRAQNDFKTHIGVEYTISFNLSSSPAFPLTVRFEEQTVATDASLTHLAEMHPIHVVLSANGANDVELSPWWTTESPLELTLEERVVKEPTLTQKGVGLFADYPILFVVVLGFLGGGILLVLRTKNTMGMDLNIFDEDDEDEPSSEEDVAEPSAQIEQETLNEASNVETETEHLVESKTTVRDTTSNRSVQSTKRRKVSPSTTRDGPITTVKRKRLDGGGNPPVQKRSTSKKRVVKVSETTKRKTRRVVTQADKDEEDTSPGE
ncbi:MAG: WD40 repeat domain-containing protein [Candidatus Poseidoniaceae archaeon]